MNRRDELHSLLQDFAVVLQAMQTHNVGESAIEALYDSTIERIRGTHPPKPDTSHIPLPPADLPETPKARVGYVISLLNAKLLDETNFRKYVSRSQAIHYLTVTLTYSNDPFHSRYWGKTYKITPIYLDAKDA